MRFLQLILDILTGRWYFVYTSGHGSAFVRDARLRRKMAAIKEARHWESIADTIGGQAYITNMFTGKGVPHY